MAVSPIDAAVADAINSGAPAAGADDLAVNPSAPNEFFDDAPIPSSEPSQPSIPDVPATTEVARSEEKPALPTVPQPEAKPETKPEAKPIAATPAKFDPLTVEMAKAVGMTDDDVKAFASPEAMMKAVNIITGRLADFGKALSPASSPAQVPNQPPQHPAQSPAAAPAAPVSATWKPKHGTEELDPVVIEELQSLHEHGERQRMALIAAVRSAMQKEIGPLYAELRAATARPQIEAWNAADGEAKKAFEDAGFGDKYDSQRVAEQAQILAVAFQGARRETPDPKLLNRMAVSTLYSDILQQITIGKLAKQLEDQAVSASVSPGGARFARDGQKSVKDLASEIDRRAGVIPPTDVPILDF